LLFLNASPRP